MVLQRDAPLPIWGWADPGEEVKVSLGDNVGSTKADAQGQWRVTLNPMSADGKTHKVVIQGANTITLDDVLIGEVWVGSGQSNMEWPLVNTNHGKEAIKQADSPEIRLFHVPKVNRPMPAKDVNAAWRVCSPQAVPGFSAVLYYFGRKLHEELKVPVGLINSSWGGSPIEPWTVSAKRSGGMYNGMIHPLKPFAVRGVVWYQGETNALQKNGLAYFDKMKALIEGWRQAWENNDLSFYYVQIAPWSGRYEPGQLPALWEAQTAALKIPHTGMVVTTDLVDNLGDIHPRNKLDVGNRLALWALAKDYGRKNLVYCGPLYKSMRVAGDKIRLQFAHADGGLKSSDGKPLTHFEIAGADGKFVPAAASIEDGAVVVKAEGVPQPKQVRFAWIKTARPNLTNGVGLPAAPFQTNHWTGGAAE